MLDLAHAIDGAVGQIMRLKDIPCSVVLGMRDGFQSRLLKSAACYEQVSVSSRTLQRDQVPEDVVGAVVYLSGASSSFVTGQTIVIDGGQFFH